MKYLFCLGALLLAFGLSGCGKEIENYVKSGPKKAISATPTPSTPIAGVTPGIQVSAGAGFPTGSQVSAHASISTNIAPLTGSTVDAKVSINKIQVDP